MSDKIEIRNCSSQQNKMNQDSSYSSVFPQPQKKFNQGLNCLKYQHQQELSSQNQFDNQQSYYQQQQDMGFDNDSMLSSNMIAQNPPFSESQDDICDMYFNPSAFLQNQEKIQENEGQNSVRLPSNNQDMYYNIEEGECAQNGDEDYSSQKEMMIESYQLPNLNMSENMNNYNFSSNIYVPNICCNQSISNIPSNINVPVVAAASQKSANAQLCANCQNQVIVSNQQFCSFCLQLQQNQQPIKYEVPKEYQPQVQRQIPQQIQIPILPCQYNQLNISSVPSLNLSQRQNGEQNQVKIEEIPSNCAVDPLCGVQQKVMKGRQQKVKPINNGIIDDAESLSEDCDDINEQQYSQSKNYGYSQDNSRQYSQENSKYSQENSKYYSEQSDSNSCNSSKNGSESYNDDNSKKNYSDQNESQRNNPNRGGRQNQKVLYKEAGNALISKKSIKKYKPKKKYKQSRQKNVFKNFGNALMNCIQNNFVIRDYIEKCLGNESSAIEAFHSAFLKDSLNHLKNKEDFLQGWRIQESSDDDQVILFKHIFKEVSLRFFNDYAAKYVNESDKLKNKDIHIKAIPIFIRGLQNVNELYKFKLS